MSIVVGLQGSGGRGFIPQLAFILYQLCLIREGYHANILWQEW
jgi:hypothetical protein